MVCICGHKSASEVIDGEDTAIVNDKSADSLSHVGGAAYNSLKRRNARYHHRLWNVTKGKVIGDIQQTPLPEDSFLLDEDPGEGHSDWFPQKMCEIMSKTKYWCDMMSLTPPDGIFLEKIKEAIETISANAEQTVIIRMMFGNIVGMPVACTSVIRALTKDLPADSHIQLYVAGWRKRTSWNHAKMIAVDGRYLHTGGHNMWSHHYLTYNPVHDLSIEMEGRITHDAHIYANEQWSWVEKKERTFIGKLSEALIPDSFPTLWKNRVNYDHFPSKGGTKFPAEYNKTTSVPKYDNPEGLVPCISIGRSGKLLPISRPADNAILAMMNSAKKNIRMSLQDLGPVCVPGTKIPLVGLKWPKPYLKALAKKIWNGVKVEIVLSNPASVPGGDMFASFGNGWSCADCTSEIIKCVRKQVIMETDHKLRRKSSR